MSESLWPSEARERLTNRWGDTGLALILFVAFRLMLLAVYGPQAVTRFGDFPYYYNLARLSDQGLYPLLHYWYEFPPLFPYLSIALYKLLGSPQVFDSYAYALALVMLAFEAGNLALLMGLARRLHGEITAERLGWVYALLTVPLVFSWWTFDAMTAFWMLLALVWLMEGREGRSAVALGLGVVTKYMPALLLATAWRFLAPRRALRYTAIVLAVVAPIIGPFLIASPRFALASLQAQASKSSWETVWALLDGNFSTGNFGPVADHFDPAQATVPLGNPPRLPPWLTLAAFGLLYAYLFFFGGGRRTDDDLTPPLSGEGSKGRGPSSVIAFTGLTWCVFFLWSRGWSPQWQMLLLPFILLGLPLGRAVLFSLALGFVNFLEWPVLLSRGWFWSLWLTVPLRTLLIGLLAVEFYRVWTANRWGEQIGVSE
jgi:hypothetical protein